ncbi:unnamed protein product [Mytilus edulis]|uniref:Uncharacterized protein n=1 Tax=Mytilus edulis TaxID=6550 RepID=A0A8S3SLS4_MYTED|nr:unnamed protein product [Mytilus edulis]
MFKIYNMSKTDRELSLNFYKYLCNVIGTEEVVKTRRKLFCALDSVLRHPTFTVISSGSKAEGVDLNGSDYDLMFVLESFQVYENMIKVSLFTNKTPIIMDISDTKPGFTKLKLFDRSNKYLRHIIQFAEILEKETYISSKLFREDHMPDCMIIHGPCQSNPDNTIDFARCVRCEEWITPAHPWIYRSRSSWPDHRLVMSVTAMMEQNTVPDEGYVFERKRKKGISKDPNAETFWADMPYYVEIAKAKEQNSKWGPKKIIAELKLGLSERVVKTVLSQYFYDQNTDCLFRKSIDLNVHHRRCVSKNDLVNMIKENHKKDHRKADTIYEALRTTVFPVVRETIKILFKTEVKCQQCASAIDLPKTTTTRRPNSSYVS